MLNLRLQVFHSDYFSGWDTAELQNVLDNCDNYAEAAMPDAFCSDWLTFRGKGKTEGVQVDDFDIREDLEKIQPAAIDTKGTISPEEVTNVAEVPRGTCTGTLLPDTNTGEASQEASQEDSQEDSQEASQEVSYEASQEE